jgi:hypothetical protein
VVGAAMSKEKVAGTNNYSRYSLEIASRSVLRRDDGSVIYDIMNH